MTCHNFPECGCDPATRCEHGYSTLLAKLAAVDELIAQMQHDILVLELLKTRRAVAEIRAERDDGRIFWSVDLVEGVAKGAFEKQWADRGLTWDAASDTAKDYWRGITHDILTKGVMAHHCEHPEGSQPVKRDLSPQQLKVMQLVARGLQNKQIAIEIGVSLSAVKCHVHAALWKLDVHNRTQAAIQFNQWQRL